MRLFIYAFILSILLIILNYAQVGWHYQNLIPTISVLNCVQFVTEDTGWAIGSCGAIIHTTDGGDT